MRFRIRDTVSIAAGAANEDRAGAAGDVAWVVDGATDVGETPLTGFPSDAAWFAHMVDALLATRAEQLPPDLARWPDAIAEATAPLFEAARRRPPAARHELPSASAVIARISAGRLDYVSVGDCTLLLADKGGPRRVGSDMRDAGDRRLAAAVAKFHETSGGTATAAEARRAVWPHIRAQRDLLNTPDGYGVLSVVPPPVQFVRSGTLETEAGTRLLLASDGLMRLVDVYRVMTDADLLARATADGIARLCADLRAIEAADAHNVRYPRAKTSDDASGLLIEIL